MKTTMTRQSNYGASHQRATLIARFPDMGAEVWATYDRGAECYDLWTDPNGTEHVGCADSMGECRAVAHQYFEELMQ